MRNFQGIIFIFIWGYFQICISLPLMRYQISATEYDQSETGTGTKNL